MPPNPNLPTTSVLLIDETETDRKYFADQLKRRSPNYKILEATDGEAGLTLYRSQQIDCVVDKPLGDGWLSRTPGPERLMCASSRTLQCELIGRVPELAEQHPPVSRHLINGTEHLSPTEIGKGRDDIVEAARTAYLQLFNNRFFNA